MYLGAGPTGLRPYVERLCYPSHIAISPLSSCIDRLGSDTVELVLRVDDVVVATVDVWLDVDVGLCGPGVVQPVGHFLEETRRGAVDRVVRGQAVLFVQLLPLIEGDAL